MSDEIRIEMMRRKADGTPLQSGSQKLPTVVYPVGDGAVEIVNAYDYFLQAFCEVRPYARVEISRLRDACKAFFEKHGCRCFSKTSFGIVISRLGFKRTTGRDKLNEVRGLSLFGELSELERAINEVHLRNDPCFVDEFQVRSSPVAQIWKTLTVVSSGTTRRLILRETVPPPIVPDGPR